MTASTPRGFLGFALRVRVVITSVCPGAQLTLFGAIYRFDVSNTPGTFHDVFATTVGATDCAKFMHRIEGLTWGPKLPGQKQQLLYATGYTGSAGAPPPVNGVVRVHLGRVNYSFAALALLAPGTKQLQLGAVLHRSKLRPTQQPAHLQHAPWVPSQRMRLHAVHLGAQASLRACRKCCAHFCISMCGTSWAGKHIHGVHADSGGCPAMPGRRGSTRPCSALTLNLNPAGSDAGPRPK